MKRLLAVGASLLCIQMMACRDQTGPQLLRDESVPLSSFASSTSCGVEFTTVAAESMPATDYDAPSTRTDTLVTCLSWASSDYSVHNRVVGTSARDVLSDPLVVTSYTGGSLRIAVEGDTLVDTEAITTLFDLVNTPEDVRSAALNDPYFMFRSCPSVEEPPYVGDPEVEVLPIVDPGEYNDDPCGGGGFSMSMSPSEASGLRLNRVSSVARRDRVLAALTHGMSRSAKLESGLWVYRSATAHGEQRILRVHPVAKVVVKEERRAPGLVELTEHSWKRLPRTGYLRTGMKVRAEVTEGTQQQVYESNIKFSNLRFGRDAR